MILTPGQIATVAHEANRAYCAAIGDDTQPSWADAPDWQKDSARSGVQAIIDGRVLTPEDSHLNWLREKFAAGWKYGPVKNPETKEHPCCVSYDMLPDEQRAKDALFFAIVKALE